MANFNFNKVILGGRLTADPELKTTPTGLSVAEFTVAVNRRYNNNDTDFITCKAWRSLAEFVCKWFKKGATICLVGSIQTRKWTDKDGRTRMVQEVVVDKVEFVDGKSDSPKVEPQFEDITGSGEFDPGTPQQDAKIEPITDDDDLPF